MKKKFKRTLALVMAFLLAVTVIPESLFASKAAEDNATPTDAESITGYVTVESNGFSGLNPAGIAYSVYSDEALETKEDTLVLSADGKCYKDSEGEPTVYSDTEDITSEKEVYYSSLTAGTYYLKMDATLYDSTDGMETTGIFYSREVTEFTIEDENPVTLSLSLSELEDTEEEDEEASDMEVITLSEEEADIEETEEDTATSTDADADCEEEITVVTALSAASTLLTSRAASLTASNSVTITNKGSYKVNQTTAGIFTATVGGTTYPAYCGDHTATQPPTYTGSYSESTNTNVRRVMAYVLDTYGNSTSLSKTLRVKISLALYCAKHNTSHSLGNAIKNSAYKAYTSSNLPLTPSQASTFTASYGSTSSGITTLELDTSSTTTITIASTGKQVEVYSSGNMGDEGKLFLYLCLGSNYKNTATITVPDGVYVRYTGTDWAAPGETVTISNSTADAFVRIAVAASVVDNGSGSSTLTFTGKNGYAVYYSQKSSSYQKIYWGYKTSYSKSVKVTWTTTTTPDTGSLRLRKYYESGFGNSYCASLSNYSRDGATYEMYLTTGNGGSKGTKVATFVTATSIYGYEGFGHPTLTTYAENLGWSVWTDGCTIGNIELGTWLYIVETEASPGCELDTTVHYVQITGESTIQTVNSYEPVNADPLAIKIQKVDSVTGDTVATASGSLEGAEFTIKYYDVDPTKYTTLSSISGLSATKTWTFVTDEDGYIDCTNSDYYSGGNSLYYDNGDIVIPYGVITIEETSAPDGYTTEGSYFFNSLTGTEYTDGIIFATVTEDSLLLYNGKNFVSADSITLIKEEVPDRADLKLTKVDAETGEAMAGVAFSLTSTTTGETHILVTDENGVIDTSAIAHSTNTNANDSKSSSAYSSCGIWFYGSTDGTGTIDDSMGALPYDTYVLSELSTSANAGYTLISDITIDLTNGSLYDEWGNLIDGEVYDEEGNLIKEGGSSIIYSDGYLLLDLGTITNSPEPVLGTRAFNVETNDGVIPADSTVTVYDEVSYSFLTAGNTYTIKGVIMDAETGKPFVDANGNYVTGSKTFTVDSDYTSYAEEKCGTVNVEYTIDTTGLAGKSLVVFEYLYEGEDTDELVVTKDGVDETGVYETNNGTEVKHTDLTDENQTLYVPEIHTTLTDSETLDHISNPDEEVTLIDTVSYTNLIIGKEYTVSGVLMDKSTGGLLIDANGDTITAEKTFTAESAAGSIDIVFTFDASLLAGETTVAFETIYYDKIEVATHTDLTDEGQTVDFPNIHTTALDKTTGTHTGTVSSKAAIVDTVTYENLIIGKEYTVTGTLIDKNTGKALKDANGKTVTVSKTFTAEETAGSIDMIFTFDASLLAGTSTVVFETIYYDGIEVAVHNDLTDEGQTINFPPETSTPPVKTGDNTPVAAAVGVFGLALIGVATLLMIKRRNRKKTDR